MSLTLALLILVAEELSTEAGLGLVRVHASHNLSVRRTSGCALQSTGIGEDLGLVKREKHVDTTDDDITAYKL